MGKNKHDIGDLKDCIDFGEKFPAVHHQVYFLVEIEDLENAENNYESEVSSH